MIEKIYLAAPRGFCAGVTRAIEIVERALEKFWAPLYVRHEIVHNKIIVAGLQKKGVIFVESPREVPEYGNIIFSAHWVSDEIEEICQQRHLNVIDASCPLVKKVHTEVIKYSKENYEIILIGHKGHPEMEGTAGRIRNHTYYIVQTLLDAQNLVVQNSNKLALATQTTLSLDDTQEIIDYLLQKYPNIILKNDICYATQNRQNAVKSILEEKIDLLLVIGSKNSSNSNRLKNLGEVAWIKSFLIDEAKEITPEMLEGVTRIWITAGASAPEHIVQSVIAYFQVLNPNLVVENKETIKEYAIFEIPKELK